MIPGYFSLRQLKYFRRYRQILKVLVKHGFVQALERVKLYTFWERIFYPRRSRSVTTQRWEYRLRLALEELGPAFVKVGQLLSTRTDLLPPSLIKELQLLQDSVSPFPADKVKQILKEELGQPADQIFKGFEPGPLAAASIGQVHKAVLSQDQDVIVKVKRPGVDKQVIEDLNILVNLAEMVDNNTNLGQVYQFSRIAQELRTLIARELDYKSEARNAQRFRQNFADDSGIYIPDVYWDYTTNNILTLEYVQGVNLGRLSAEDKDGKLGWIAKQLTESFFKQVFIDGFFHGDPHPGNIALVSDGRLSFMDFGSAGFISDELRAKFVTIFLAFKNLDSAALVDELLTFAFVPPVINRQELIRDMRQIQEQYFDLPLKDININKVLQEVMGTAAKHSLRFPYEFLLLAKALLTLEGTVHSFNPDFNLALVVEEYGPALKKKQIKYARRRIAGTMRSYRRLAEEIPERFVEILRETSAGELKLKVEISRTENILKTFETMVNRLAFSIVLASLIIALSQILHPEETFLLSRLPVVDIALVGAGLAGFWWLISIIRSGRF